MTLPPPVLQTSIALGVFVLTYVGMGMGHIPKLKVDRTGIGLIALAILLVTGTMPFAKAVAVIDGPTLVLMFALMMLSAQFAGAGFYDACAARLAAAEVHPKMLLALVVLVAAALSAVMVNDIIVFAMTPILCSSLHRRGLDPKPYLMGLAGACNAGSAATLIGNPQNILIGQVGKLGFWHFFAVCAPPAAAALVCVYGAVLWRWRRELAHDAGHAPPVSVIVDKRQAIKGLIATVAVMILFATSLPREVAALAVAAVLLISRKVASRDLVMAADWGLLLMIACLFVVTGAFAATGLPQQLLGTVKEGGLSPSHLAALVPGALLVSNTIGNVPATILVLSLWPQLPPGTLYGLALLTTLAGNLLLVGSLCNLIVAERAGREGVTLTFADFARAGIPAALTSMAIASIWLWLGGWVQL